MGTRWGWFRGDEGRVGWVAEPQPVPPEVVVWHLVRVTCVYRDGKEVAIEMKPTSRELWKVWDEIVRGAHLSRSYENVPDMVRDLCTAIISADESIPMKDRDQVPFPFYNGDPELSRDMLDSLKGSIKTPPPTTGGE